MLSRSNLVSEIQQLLTGEHADPRAAQGVFLIPVVFELLLHGRNPVGFDAYFYGCVVALVPTLGSVAIGRRWVAARWTIWLPVLDIAALGVFRLSGDSVFGIALAFPAIWLGLQFGRRGVGVMVVALVLCFVLPTMLVFGFTQEILSRLTQVTLTAVICSAAVAMTGELWKAQVAETRKGTARLERAMSDIIEQRKLTKTIINGVDVGLLSIDADGVIDSMNPRQQDFIDLAFPEGHGGRAGQTGFVYDADGTTILDRECMPTSRALNGETFSDLLVWVGNTPDVRRALAVSSTPYYRVDGGFGGAVLAFHDITELVMASRIKDEFVASVSHELRTPLTSIVGYVDFILEDARDLPDDVRAYLVTVQRNAGRLHRLVDDLLTTGLQSVSALDMGRVSLTELLERSFLEAGKSATAAGLTLELESFEAGPDHDIDGDPERLAQVFDNLFSNAIKYTPREGRVTVGLSYEVDHAIVRVRDTGRGISEEELGEIFTKFFRGSTVLTDAIPGIGLGLAITKSIVEAHGGQIEVFSELGKGTTFVVRLPRRAAQPAAVA